MNAVIYCRVMPHNKGVAKSDRLENQENRCRSFARQLNLRVLKVYRDEGEMHPIHFLPAIRLLFSYLLHSKEDLIVISDHPARLGLDKKTRSRVLDKIQEFDGQFIAAHVNPAFYIESLGAEIINTIKKEL